MVTLLGSKPTSVAVQVGADGALKLVSWGAATSPRAPRWSTARATSSALCSKGSNGPKLVTIDQRTLRDAVRAPPRRAPTHLAGQAVPRRAAQRRPHGLADDQRRRPQRARPRRPASSPATPSWPSTTRRCRRATTCTTCSPTTVPTTPCASPSQHADGIAGHRRPGARRLPGTRLTARRRQRRRRRARTTMAVTMPDEPDDRAPRWPRGSAPGGASGVTIVHHLASVPST